MSEEICREESWHGIKRSEFIVHVKESYISLFIYDSTAPISLPPRFREAIAMPRFDNRG